MDGWVVNGWMARWLIGKWTDGWLVATLRKLGEQ